MKLILNLKSDFPFTQEDFIQEFSVYDMNKDYTITLEANLILLEA